MTPHPATLDESTLLAECEFRTTRRSGPGGQHRNKVETTVILTHSPTGVAAEANESRSQAANRRRAIHRLRVRLAMEVRTEPADVPSDLWKNRVKGSRIAVNPEHDDYPALLAEVLNQLSAHDFETVVVAEKLRVSATQLINLVRHTPIAFQTLNAARTIRGLRPLK